MLVNKKKDFQIDVIFPEVVRRGTDYYMHTMDGGKKNLILQEWEIFSLNLFEKLKVMELNEQDKYKNTCHLKNTNPNHDYYLQ